MEGKYEVCFVLRSDLPDDEVEKEIEYIEKVLVNGGAKIFKKENLGRKILAYPIKKRTEGIYFVFYFTAPGTIKETIDSLKLRENILRYLLIRRKILPHEEIINAESQS
ncbi:MAG TPA: 30S ribosomal protein S6 [Candidatus Ratteibacteria bacterium]|nr:30S ribosomal protein S6 [bacterium]HRR96822.1 30S ribosomal protein S6 [Candidatus Ratteibacteria bacterium]